tara:strand:- start:87 stop:3740 length:3654 start_codon:yes stop_codon:yes gene_type:complete
MATISSGLFEGDNYDDYVSTVTNTPINGFLNNATASQIFGDDKTTYNNYLKDRYASDLLAGRFVNPKKPFSETDYENARTYLDFLPQDPEEESRVNRLARIRQYMGLYQAPETTQPLNPLQAAEDFNIPGSMAVFPTKEKAETDYGISQENFFIDEEERDYYRLNDVNPDRYFNAGDSALKEWTDIRFKEGDFDRVAKDAASIADPTGLVGLAMLAGTPIANQFVLDPTSPWKLKAAVGLPVNPTPREMEFVMKDEFPNIVGKIRYIDFKDPSKGLAVRVPKNDGSGEEFIPLNPQFGLTMVGEEVLRGIAQETGTIVTESLLRLGPFKAIQRMIQKGSAEVAKNISTETVKVGGMKRAGKSAITTSVSTAFGRYAQLMAMKEAGVNNIDETRAFEDAKVAAAFAGGSSLAISTGMGILSKITRAITGKDIPKEKLIELQNAINKLNRPKKETTEYTNEELVDIAQEIGEAAGKDIDLSNFTVGQLTEDANLQILQQELFALLEGRGYESTELFRKIVLTNREAAYEMWRSLTQYNPAFKNLKLNDFQKYLKEQQDEALENAKIAAEIEKEEIVKASKLSNQLDSASPIQQTTEELSAPFVRTAESGNVVFSRQSKEFLLDSDTQFANLKNNYETALNAVSDLRYPEAGQSTALIVDAFRKVLNAGDKDSIIKMIADVELSDVLKNVIPMRNGVSTLRQLAGELKDSKGDAIPQLNLSFGDLVSMRSAVENILLTHPDNAVKAAAKPLLTALDDQTLDLLRMQARNELKEQGIETAIPARLDQYIRESETMAPVLAARDAFESYKRKFDRTYLKDFSEQSPNKLAPFVLNSTPEQIDGLFQNIYASPEGIVKLQNIRQLVLDDIAKSVDNFADPVTQNKQWLEYYKKHEEQLEALFPESQFSKLKNYASVQETGIDQINKIDAALAGIEKDLDLEFGFSDFVSKVLMASKQDKLTGKDQVALDGLNVILGKYPELRSVVFEMTKANLRRRFEGFGLTNPGILDPSEVMFVNKGAFDFNAFQNFISEAEESGVVGGEQFGDRLADLLGPNIGRKYAEQLRATGYIFNKMDNASVDQVLNTSRKGTANTLEGHMSLFSALQRIFISPLTKTSRQLTFLKEKLTLSAADDLLTVLTDPSKLDRLIKNRNKQMSFNEFIKFMASLAAARSAVDIGSEKSEGNIDRKIKTLDQKRDDLGYFVGEVDTFSRIRDLLTPDKTYD